MENLSPIIPGILFIVIFPLFWCGWARLAKYYRYDGTFQGQQWSMQSARISWSGYNGVLTVGANWEGLYLRPMFLFRCGHPPLFFPWYDLSVHKRHKVPRLKRSLIFAFSAFPRYELTSVKN